MSKFDIIARLAQSLLAVTMTVSTVLVFQFGHLV
jgi:hypothetical protein